MKKNEQTIKCSVEDCRHYKEKYCCLNKIQVAHCDAKANDGTKEATMCDSYETE